jgi:replicative DNA helicase
VVINIPRNAPVGGPSDIVGRGDLAPIADWTADTPDGTAASRSLLTVAMGERSNLDLQTSTRAIPTGFPVLDSWISNGLKPGELLLMGGAPGVGKTTLCLQMARNIAASGEAAVLYACYEHQAEYLLDRLLVQETINPTLPATDSALNLNQLHELISWAMFRFPDVPAVETLWNHPTSRHAVEAFRTYAGRFHIVEDAPRHNRLNVLTALIEEHRRHNDEPLVLFVDYLQKIESDRQDLVSEDDRMTDVVQVLKQLALEYRIAVVAIAAADKVGIKSPRLRLSHFRGSSALMYEADIAVIMNDKWQIIDRDRLVFNQHKANEYREWVVCTIEKNRAGRNLLEFELRKRFEHCCFDPSGGRVSERLYEERIQGDR